MDKDLEKASNLAVKTLKNGNKILLFGNGGSAADAQHIAAELTGRYKSERRGLPAIALTTENSPEMKTQGKKVGLVGWLTKPFSDEKLHLYNLAVTAIQNLKDVVTIPRTKKNS
jgi:CheY-like chemotaxis protein